MKTIKIKLSNKDRFFYKVMASEKLKTGGTIKEIEIELQNIIESIYNEVWYKCTNRNIFIDLLEYCERLDNYIFNILIPSLKD